MSPITRVMQPPLTEVTGRVFQPAAAAGGVISIHAPIMTLHCVWGAGPAQEDRGGRAAMEGR